MGRCQSVLPHQPCFTIREIHKLDKLLSAGLLTLALAATTGAQAQTATAGAAPAAANPVDPGAIQALKGIDAHLQTLKHAATADLDDERPNRLRAVMASARSERRFIFDGKRTARCTHRRRSSTRQCNPPY